MPRQPRTDTPGRALRSEAHAQDTLKKTHEVCSTRTLALHKNKSTKASQPWSSTCRTSQTRWRQRTAVRRRGLRLPPQLASLATHPRVMLTGRAGGAALCAPRLTHLYAVCGQREAGTRRRASGPQSTCSAVLTASKSTATTSTACAPDPCPGASSRWAPGMQLGQGSAGPPGRDHARYRADACLHQRGTRVRRHVLKQPAICDALEAGSRPQASSAQRAFGSRVAGQGHTRLWRHEHGARDVLQ